MKKKYFNLIGLFALAATLCLTVSSCSEDDANPIEVSSTEVSKVHFSLNAGLGDNFTRTAVTTSDNKHRITFTEKDRLFVKTEITKGDDSKIISGYLSIKSGTLAADGQSATFEGDLDVYEKDADGYYKPSTYSFNETELNECRSRLDGCLMADPTPAYRIQNNYEIFINQELQFGANPDEILKYGCIPFHFQAYSGKFEPELTHCIFDCSISGLTDGTYTVEFIHEFQYDSNGTPVKLTDFSAPIDITSGTVTVSGGIAKFAVSFEAGCGEMLIGFCFTNQSDSSVKILKLGYITYPDTPIFSPGKIYILNKSVSD